VSSLAGRAAEGEDGEEEEENPNALVIDVRLLSASSLFAKARMSSFSPRIFIFSFVFEERSMLFFCF
jgi:hypothetical protein